MYYQKENFRVLGVLTSFLSQTYIPKTLDDVKNAEQDVQRVISGKDTEDMYYQTITGMKKMLTLNNSSQAETEKHQSKGTLANEDSAKTVEGSGESETETEESDDETDSCSGNGKQTPLEKKAARKENKKKVKEEKRESRKSKVPKAVKKKKKKLAKGKKYR